MHKPHSLHFLAMITLVLIAWHWHIVLSNDAYMWLLIGCGWLFGLSLALREDVVYGNC